MTLATQSDTAVAEALRRFGEKNNLDWRLPSPIPTSIGIYLDIGDRHYKAHLQKEGGDVWVLYHEAGPDYENWKELRDDINARVPGLCTFKERLPEYKPSPGIRYGASSTYLGAWGGGR